MSTAHLADPPPVLHDALDAYDEVFVVVSPPRCGSTAFARVLWRNPRIGYYSHEPFEVTYFDDESLDAVAAKLRAPIDLAAVTGAEHGAGLLIKEMPYQVGEHFTGLMTLATRPLVFLARDPRLSIASRIRKKRLAGADPDFPKIETGWQLLAAQVRLARDAGVDYVVVDATDFRTHPESVFAQVAAALDVPWGPQMLKWKPRIGLPIDNLGGRHDHLYRRVLASTGIEPPTEEVPDLAWFPQGSWRRHVRECLGIYDRLLADPRRIRPA